MKQIFTLLTIAFVSVFSTKANSQNINEGFETAAEVTNLINSCWTFNNFNYSNSSPITGSGSAVSQLGTLSELVTPELQIPSTLSIAFSYNTVASNTGSKTLKVLLDINGVETILETINLNSATSGNFTASYTNANTPGNNINGSRKVIFRTTSNVSVQIDDLSINAPYTYASGCAFANIPLPIQLISFNGSLVNNKVQLKWFVAENETGSLFEIEKSSDGSNYKSIGIVVLTSKIGTQDYAFNEGIELSGAGYYRLKIVNKNGSVVYSNIVVLKNEQSSTVNSLLVLQNKGAEVTFNYATAKEGIYNVNVYNVNGAKMFATSITMQRGMNAASLRANGLISSGVYVLEVTNGLERSITKFLK